MSIWWNVIFNASKKFRNIYMLNQTSLIYSSETWGFQVSFFWVCKQNPGGAYHCNGFFSNKSENSTWETSKQIFKTRIYNLGHYMDSVPLHTVMYPCPNKINNTTWHNYFFLIFHSLCSGSQLYLISFLHQMVLKRTFFFLNQEGEKGNFYQNLKDLYFPSIAVVIHWFEICLTFWWKRECK